MNRFLFLISFGLLFFLPSCSDSPEPEITTSLELNFKASYDEDLFLTFNEYEYPDGKKIQFSNFNFFISDVSLISSTGENTQLLEVELIDLTFRDAEITAAEQGISLFVREVPVGNYTGIKIGYGVSADLNRTEPSMYGGNHPLKENYWEGWTSYIFSIIEGGADMNEDGEIVLGGSEGESFTYHSGTDDVYVTGVIDRNIELKFDAIEKFEFNIDVKQLFKNNNPTYDTNSDGYLDIETFSATHSEGQLEISKRIMENFKDAISL